MSKQVARWADRRISLIGITAFVLAGAMMAWSMPLIASKYRRADVWFAPYDGTAATWVLLGLLFALTGTTLVRSLGIDRKGRRRARSTARARNRQGVAQAVTGSSTPSVDGDRRRQAALPIALPQRLPMSSNAEHFQLQSLHNDQGDFMPVAPYLLEQPLTGDPMATPDLGVPLPLELATQVQCRDRYLDSVGHTAVRLVYLPSDPYAMHVYISEPGFPRYWAESHWVGSRDAFISAGCRGVSLPGLDMVVVRVIVGHGFALRVALHETDPTANGGFGALTGEVLHLDFDLDRPLWEFLEQITLAVPMGSEHHHLDLDGMISQLLIDN